MKPQIRDLSNATGRFYIYLYRLPASPEPSAPIYVGKGTQNPANAEFGRARFHWVHRSSNRGLQQELTSLRRAGLAPIIDIVARFESEAEAFEYEAMLIVKFGRRDLGLGSLYNLSDGGEGPVGFRHSENARQKISQASRSMHGNPDIAARRAANISAALSTVEAKEHRSAFMREVHARPGSIEKRISSQKRTFATTEYKAKQAEASRRSQARPEVKEKHAAGLRNRHAAPGAREKVGAASRRAHADPLNKEKHRQAMREWRSRPEIKARYAEFYERRRLETKN